MVSATRRLTVLRLPSERFLYGAVGFVAILALWEVVSVLGVVKKSLLSSPTLIWTTATQEFGSGAIWPHITTSLSEWAIGFAIALAIGIPVGLGIGLFRRVYYLLDIWMSAVYATPTVALVPLIILVFGIGLESKVVVVVLNTIFEVIVSTSIGVKTVESRYLDTSRSFGASRWLTFRSVILPSTVPFILTGVRIGTGRALVGVVVAEFLAANQGIGFYIIFAGTVLNTSKVMLGLILLGVFGVLVGELVRILERRVEAWRPAIR
jgi:NitT/TauT family transport system permease protein